MSKPRESSLIPEGTEKSDGGVASPSRHGFSSPAWVEKIKNTRVKVKLPALKELTWDGVWKATVEFLADPINVALVVWMLLSIPACILIMAIKLGILNSVLSPEQREHVDEVATQVVNALFALTCLIVFPMLCRHTFILLRWNPKDKVELRHAFCKNGKRKPHDRTHMAVVIFWGQVTCWATFAFAAVYWLFPVGSRPAWLISVIFVVSMVAPVISFLYLLLSPLSKDYDIVKEGDDNMLRMYKRTQAFFDGEKQVQEPKWNGSVVPGCCSDKKLACLVCVFPCCMFGYNMERLGFGHRVVHTLAFVVVLIGPLLVFEFSSAALGGLGNAGRIIYYSGVLLCVIGTAYGGAWRMKMRETYHLPGSTACCCNKRATDICTWIWCSYCALCQEIRTTEQYQVEESAFQYSQTTNAEADGPDIVAPEGDDEITPGPAQMSPPRMTTMEAEPKNNEPV